MAMEFIMFFIILRFFEALSGAGMKRFLLDIDHRYVSNYTHTAPVIVFFRPSFMERMSFNVSTCSMDSSITKRKGNNH